jgi:hypothetical protein
MVLAGPIAEHVAGYSVAPSDHTHDRDALRALLQAEGHTVAEAIALRGFAFARAETLVARHWSAIHLVAHALQERHTLSGEEVAQLVAALSASPSTPTPESVP